MTPKEKANDLVNTILNIDNKSEIDLVLATNISLLCVKEIQEFGNKVGIREPMMYWGVVRKELIKNI